VKLSAPEAGGLSRVEGRLIAKFVPPLRPEDVRRCVQAAASRYDSARVPTYLTILIERTASELLAVELRALPHVAGDDDHAADPHQSTVGSLIEQTSRRRDELLVRQ
jgi:hypothetical protein